jgi:hypothetical protein
MSTQGNIGESAKSMWFRDVFAQYLNTEFSSVMSIEMHT